MKENVVLKVVFDTEQAEQSTIGLRKEIDKTDASTKDYQKTLDSANKELSEFDRIVKGGTEGLKNLANAKKSFNDISIVSSTNEVKQLANELQNILMKDREFMQEATKVAEKVKQGVLTDVQAFKILEDAINKGVQAVSKLEKETTQAVQKTTSFRTEMRNLTNEINSGKLEGKELIIAKQRLADMKGQMGDLAAQTKILGSDTRALDTAMQGLGLGVGIFASLQGASALFGSENEKVQQAILKVTAAMSVLQGLQQVQNTLDKESGFLLSVKSYWMDLTGKSAASQALAQEIMTAATNTDTIATEANVVAKEGNTIATTIYGAALNTVAAISRATGLTMAQSWAVATLGLSVLITGITLLILNWEKLFDVSERLTEQQKLQKKYAEDISNVQKQTIENNSKEISQVISLGVAIKDQNLSQEERLKALRQYNQIADENNKIDETQINNSALVEAAIRRQTDLIIRRSLVIASQNEIEKLIQSTLKERLQLLEIEANFIKQKQEFDKNGIQIFDATTDKIGLMSEETKRLRKVVDETDERVRKLVEAFGVLDITNAVVSPKNIEIKSNKDTKIKISDGKIKFDFNVGELSTEGLIDAIDDVDIKDFSIPFAVTPIVNVDDVIDSVDRIVSIYKDFVSRNGNLGGVFSELGGIAGLIFNAKDTREAIKKQEEAIELDKKDILSTTRLYNDLLIQAEQQVTEAVKSGNKERIQEAIASQESLKKQYSEALEEQNKAIQDGENNLSSLNGRLNEMFAGLTTGVLNLALQISSSLTTLIDNNIARYDELIDKQKSQIEVARELALKGNSQLLEAEEKKLEKLNDLRREEQRKKKAAAISEAIINTALAVTNVWASNAGNIPLAAVLTAFAIAQGAIQVGIISSQQFKKGGLIEGKSHEEGGQLFTVKGRPNYVGEYEGGEFIFNKDITKKNLKWFEKINKENLSLDTLMSNTLNLRPELSTIMVNKDGELYARLDKVEKAIINLPKYMPRPSFNADSRGLSMRMSEIIDKENRWKS